MRRPPVSNEVDTYCAPVWQVLTMIYIIVTCALHLYFLTIRREIDLREALKQGAGSAVAFSMSVVVIWPVLALLSYHLRVCRNSFRLLWFCDANAPSFSYSSST